LTRSDCRAENDPEPFLAFMAHAAIPHVYNGEPMFLNLDTLDLDTLANLAEIFGAIMIIGGALFAMVQIRQMRHQRRNPAAIAFLDSDQDGDFARA
jgi:hypothetical protein